jgi:hypothetical protein
MNFDGLTKTLKGFRFTDSQINGIVDFINLNEDVKLVMKDKNLVYMAAAFVFNSDIPELNKVNKKKIDDELERLLEVLNRGKRITENQLLMQKFEIISYAILLEKLKSIEETE